MQHRLFSLIPLLLSATLLPGCSERQPPVRVASGGHILNFLPFDVAMAKGFFQEEGLDLEVTYLTGGTTTAQALLAGQVDFSLNAIDYAYKAAARGKSNGISSYGLIMVSPIRLGSTQWKYPLRISTSRYRWSIE